MANSSPPWAAYCVLMVCRLVALDKRPGVRPVGIGEALLRDLAKLVVRAAGDQAKTACGNLQLCAGLEAGIEGATHAVGKRRLERVQRRSQEGGEAEADEEEGGVGGFADTLNNLTIETVRMEEEVVEQLTAVLEMELEEEGEGEEESDGDLMELVALEFLTQDAEPSETTLIDARNGFNDLSRLAMLWNVRHRWPVGSRFAFNCYICSEKLLLRQLGGPLVIILSR